MQTTINKLKTAFWRLEDVLRQDPALTYTQHINLRESLNKIKESVKELEDANNQSK
jgi:hypothetical protein